MTERDSVWIEVLSEGWSGPARLRVTGRSMWPSLRPGDHVTVEPATAEELRPGDWVVLRADESLLLHRFLGVNSDGLLVTKGDSHRAPDSPWIPESLLGRATAVARNGRTLPVSPSSPAQRARTAFHRLVAATWSVFRRVGLVLLLLMTLPATALAAVDLVSFEAIPEVTQIRITWETASEIGSVGFYVQRALAEGGPYDRISGLIPAECPFGCVYPRDQMGVTYYYRLEEVQVNGQSAFYWTVSATLSPPTTETPTPTPTPTPGPGPSPTSTVPPPQPMIEFWADRALIRSGECTTLHWRTEDVREVYYQGEGVVGNEDRRECPTQTTTYVLQVDTGHGDEWRYVTVTVEGGTPSLTVTPSPLPPTTTPAAGSPSPTATGPLPTVTSGSPSPTSRPTVTPSPTSTRSPASPTPRVASTATSSLPADPQANTAAPRSMLWMLCPAGALVLVNVIVVVWLIRRQRERQAE